MRKRILFVDDEPLVLQGLRRVLHGMRQEWDTDFVDSGAAALQALEKTHYDVIITDMRMPLMDGAQLLEQVKQRHPEMVRMVLSGQSSRASMLRSISPAHQYVSKPCDPQELKIRLAQAFAMRDLLNNQSVNALVSGLKSIPSLPALYESLMAELQTEEPSLPKLAGIISKDVGMAVKILQLANSAFIGLRCHVSNLTQAVCMIGMDMLRALVLTAHVFSQFEGQRATDALLASLWEHSVIVGSLAQRIAVSEQAPKGLVDESFTAGLLHDVGKAVLLTQMTANYSEVFKRVAENPGSNNEMEREVLGCTHAEVGAYLMGIWGLPHPLVHAVGFHDRPSESVEESFSCLTTVHFADAIASAQDQAAINHDIKLDESYLTKLKLTVKLPLWQKLHQEQLEGKTEKVSV